VNTCFASKANSMVNSGRDREVNGMNSANSDGLLAEITCLPIVGAEKDQSSSLRSRPSELT